MDKLDLLFEKLSRGALILTANNRLCTWLIHKFNSKQTIPAWESPNILPIQAWLEKQWQLALLRGKTLKRLLSPFQEQLLWQQIISENHDNPLLNISGTANNVQQAWKLLCEWELPYDQKTFNETDHGKQFYKWTKTFLESCEKKQLQDRASLYHAVGDLFQHQAIANPDHIILLGFVEKTPAFISLLNLLRETGSEIEAIHLTEEHPSAQRVALQNTDAEIQAMASWAKSNTQDNKCIACVVPELNQHRNTIERIFNEVFLEKKNLFNISSGTSLADEPMIEIALSLLELNVSKIMINDFGHLLRSPFIIDAENKISSRALLDEEIRAMSNVSYSLNELFQLIPEKSDKALFNAIKQILLITTSIKQTPYQWAETFLHQLKIWGWPGERILNSREYQTVDHFKKTLNEFSQLESMSSAMNISTAIHIFRQLTVNTLFQPQTTDAPIQVLGMLEMNGLTFDEAWIMGLDHQRWPSKPKPNPLLPIKLQRQFKTPHASSERELEFCKLMTEQFLNCASNVICSYSLENDERKLTISPLIQHLPEITLDISEHKTLEETLFASETIEEIIDDFALPISENKKIRGGTSIFKLQAECPFRAFAKLRLQSESMSEPEIGLNSKERGSLVHKVLELFWRVTKTHEKLISMTNDEIDSLIQWCVNKAIPHVLENRHIPKSLMSLEKRRLHDLIIAWLAIEKDRKPFTVVAQEQWQSASIGKIPFRMKIDRMDQLENNHYAIIDYKTGQAHISAWFGERMDEPQLPLYAICAKEPISVIAFAQIRTGDVRFKGVSIEENLLPNVQKLTDLTWDAQIKVWSKNLLNLANDFYQGNAKVDPKDTNKTCRNCDLHTLCRIYEK